MRISIDRDKCTLCGLCLKECIHGVFKNTGDKIIAYRPEACSLCGHCVAVCPTDAIEHSGMDTTQIKRLGHLPENVVFFYRNIIRLRRSIRNYKDKPVPREVMEDLIDTARYSPSAHNLQNVCYTVITDRNILKDTSTEITNKFMRLLELTEKPWVKFLLNIFRNSASIKRINSFIENSDFYKSQMQGGRDMIFHGAPVLILLHARPAPLADANCYIAATNIVNYASSLGLGTCFIGILTESVKFNKRLKDKLGIPAKERLFAAIVCGYPEYKFTKSVSRKPASINWR